MQCLQVLHGGQTLNDGVSRPHTEANSGFNIPADSALVTNGRLAQQSIKSKRRHVETTSQNPKIQDGETVETLSQNTHLEHSTFLAGDHSYEDKKKVHFFVHSN